ncbi:MAG: hypothetical protein Q4D58_00745 [Synergistaceae bacterium]|nr:hypothetical protein [Synergistaceae bacterium]
MSFENDASKKRGSGGLFREGLPYVDDFRLILLTAAVNLACFLFFYYGREIRLGGLLADSFFCGVITPFIDVFLVFSRVRTLRLEGGLPAAVPVSAFAMRLPRSPLALSILFALFFAVVTPLTNFALIKFYGMTRFSFAPMALWKVVYSCLLSAKIVELAVLRYVQPDCALPNEAARRGADSVKDPLPRLSLFKECFGAVTGDFGLNLLVGLLFGGVVISGRTVVILPTTRDAIVIPAVILGLIVTLCMAYPVARGVAETAAELPGRSGAAASRRLLAPWKLALALSPLIIALAVIFFWSVMTIFNFEELNFFQFFLIRAIFVSLLSKLVARIAVAHYMRTAGLRE